MNDKRRKGGAALSEDLSDSKAKYDPSGRKGGAALSPDRSGDDDLRRDVRHLRDEARVAKEQAEGESVPDYAEAQGREEALDRVLAIIDGDSEVDR